MRKVKLIVADICLDQLEVLETMVSLDSSMRHRTFEE